MVSTAVMRTHMCALHGQELDNHLSLSPKLLGSAAPTKSPDDKIKDSLEFGAPKSYQHDMVPQRFDPVIHIMAEFIEFYEHLEAVQPTRFLTF